MGALEKVIQFQKEGRRDGEIIQSLKEEGFSPGAINDALNQSKIKYAVGKETMEDNKQMRPSIMQPAPEEYQNQGYDGKEENIEKTNSEEYYSGGGYTPQAYPEDQAYSQEQYYEDDYSQGGNYQDTDTMIEIAEQVFSEKIKDLNNKLREVREFKTIYQEKIDDMNERLKRMEKMFDKMQLSILDKVGSFGKDISVLKKEVEMVEESFSKIQPAHKKK